MAKATKQSVCFPEAFSKPVQFEFDAEALTSDGGAVLLGALDRGCGFSAKIVEALSDSRNPNQCRHPYLDLFRQRVYGIALGYADGNDAGRISADPGVKAALNRGLDRANDLASSATLCRFENGVSAREVIEASRTLETVVIKRLKRRFRKAKLITLDFDSSDDPTHGQQAFTFYDGHYRTHCYQPLFAWVSFDGSSDQYLVHSRLRPGNCGELRTVLPTLRRLITRLRTAFPKARIRVRADTGFGRSPKLLDAFPGKRVIPPPGRYTPAWCRGYRRHPPCSHLLHRHRFFHVPASLG